MLTVRIQEKNYSESIMVLKLKDGYNAHKHKFLYLKPFGFRQDRMSAVLSDVSFRTLC